MQSKVVFADKQLKDAFDKLQDSKTEDKNLYKWLNRAFDDVCENAFCGIQIHNTNVNEPDRKRNMDAFAVTQVKGV